MRVEGVGGKVSFQQKLNATQMKKYTSSINKSLKLLNKEVDVILHNSSAPSIKEENVGIGSLFSNTVKNKLIPFLKQHGFSGIQQEPNGLRKPFDNSPYASLSESKNIFMIPLEKLASGEYEHILSKKTFENIVKNNPKANIVDYNYVKENYNIALREAYENIKSKPNLWEQLEKDFDKDLHEKTAIFNVLSKEYNTDDWTKWKQIDKTLFSHIEDINAQKRILELKNKYKDDIEFFNFTQMILENESKKANELTKQTGVKIIGDSPVAQPTVTEWIYQDLFLKDKAIGCPPDYFSKNGQRWGFKYFNPKEIFNTDGSLGKAGEVLRQKYENYFATCSGGIRIDHIIGLIDPFIYSTKSKKMTPENSGRIFSQAGEFQKQTTEDFASILKKIVIPAAEKYGIKKENIICEDLGDATKPVQDVMRELNLTGINVTQFNHRGKNAKPNSVIMLGSHDNQSYLEFTDNLFKKSGSIEFLDKTKMLAEDTKSQNLSQVEGKEYLENIRTNKSSFINASFVELFTSPAKKVQIFFTDLFGIPKTYNKPGTTRGNWALRLDENFEKDYYQAVAEGKAPNFAKILGDTLRHFGLDKNNQTLIKDLDETAKILSQKS